MPFELINPDGKANIVLISEHASNHIPAEYNQLGLSDEQLEMHIAWDIGIAEVTKNLAEMLDAPAILAKFSRLLIDANRALDQAGLIPEISDGHEIHGNKDLCDIETQKRIDRFYHPFHDNTDKLIQNKANDAQAPIIFNMHSFTPSMNDFDRPWHTGMLWNRDKRAAAALINSLKKRGFTVGDNEPYSGQELNHTMNQHGTRHGFPHVNIEIRQNEIDHQRGIDKWSRILAEDIEIIRDMPEMADIIHY
ncbi:N-formylglutamate amidohydrolase [Pseudemcibacter aquimaris]|uniref:N-formylglutamate amidohydrolase n=1 Tax=Pseudemcibacter aquimaris TaxID=2857064 RepID=UPI002010D5DD|nr:N-formylglutamate amidohydrolase [Pseudemcibacter aquimaris]MCC3860053.1 N-formylglutamate amidohydrolase [Pseudemcibacter aquimaris]WDU57383.1 N-formylglutamate amidohydrolase [Pseudemcibacter aquimaris]